MKYPEDFINKVICGDCLKFMKDIPDNSIDTIITDPPYGLGFMGKDWDTFKKDQFGKKGKEGKEDLKVKKDFDILPRYNKGIEANYNLQEFSYIWSKEALRVSKPGAIMLCFGGTRTFHRIACGIEDAGWEIRDTLMWVYGSGFPKSHNIGKAIDRQDTKDFRQEVGMVIKQAREDKKMTMDELCEELDLNAEGHGGMVNHYENGRATPTLELWKSICDVLGIKKISDYKDKKSGRLRVTGKVENPISWFGEGIKKETTTPEAKKWEGYGTALKPAWENITVAQKPFDNRSVICYNIIKILDKFIGGLKCQLKLDAEIVERYSKLNQAGLKEELDTAIWDVVKNINILEDLNALMDILRSKKMENLNLNTVLLWLKILTEICEKMSKFTTKMETALITDLKILNLLLSEDIFQNIIQPKEIKQHGIKQGVYTAINLFNAVKAKLNATNILSVQENVISKVNEKELSPNYEPIIMAMKPKEGTYAENALKYDVAGLNIDRARIPTDENTSRPHYNKKGFNCYGKYNDYISKNHKQGRFPANLIHDGSKEVEECFPKTKTGKVASHSSRGMWGSGKDTSYNKNEEGYNSASRYFKRIKYCPKASKKERNMGLEEFEENYKGRYGGTKGQESYGKNNHPTVKPLALMEYLVELTKMPNKDQIYLDPFIGSGTTAMAVKKLGRNCIGIEKEKEYVKIAEARIKAIQRNLF